MPESCEPEIITVADMYAADRSAAGHGIPSISLMENAGRAVAENIVQRWSPRPVLVLSGPGNNGGDGYVAARRLREQGWPVRVAQLGSKEALRGDAAAMAARWSGEVEGLNPGCVGGADLVIDAIFGAGLARPLEGIVRDTVLALDRSQAQVVAVDVPSGIQGDLARPIEGVDGVALQADLTLTFFRRKPAHVLVPGRLYCGEVIVADIGIPEFALTEIQPRQFVNGPALWGADYPWPATMGHKYGRGHAVIVSGPVNATGAARLAARAALRIGAGLSSVASPPAAISVNAAALTAVMVKPFVGAAGLSRLLADKRMNAVCIGPGCGIGRGTQDMVAAVLASAASVVLDADGLTSFSERPDDLFRQLREPAVLTPHAGEFERIFPGLLARSPTRIEAVREAAATVRSTVLLKGPDTAIASNDGRVAVAVNAPPTLATAGAGDVLAGMIVGLLAQGMDSFSAAAAGAWLHGEAAARFGHGLIAEDLPELLPPVLRSLYELLHG